MWTIQQTVATQYHTQGERAAGQDHKGQMEQMKQMKEAMEGHIEKLLQPLVAPGKYHAQQVNEFSVGRGE